MLFAHHWVRRCVHFLMKCEYNYSNGIWSLSELGVESFMMVSKIGMGQCRTYGLPKDVYGSQFSQVR